MIAVDKLSTTTTCREKWDEMDGTPNVRYCESCRHYVYKLDGLSTAQAETLIERYERTKSVTLYRRPDGTVTTANAPTGLKAVRERIAVGALVALTCGTGMFAAGTKPQATMIRRMSTQAIERKAANRPTPWSQPVRCGLVAARKPGDATDRSHAET
jgi:hypothetical protein